MSEPDQPLHPIEKKILKTLSSVDEAEIQDLARLSGLSIDQVRRGVEWLKAKDLVSVKETENEFYSLGEYGRRVIKIGLPERRLVNEVKTSGSSEDISKVSRELGNEFAVALGIAKKNRWVRVDRGRIYLEKEHENREPEEDFLEKVAGETRVSGVDISPQEREIISLLMKRQEGFLKEAREKILLIALTPKGRSISHSIVDNEIDEITPDILRSGSGKIDR